MVRIQLKRSGTLDKFQDLYDTDADMVFLWGSRDLGKSDNLARVLCDKCMRPEPFKCILLREIQDTVYESNYAEIVTFIENNNLEEYFECTKMPLRITYKPNGNCFVGTGGDKPRKLKGIKNPTHLWAEEADGIKIDTLQTAIGSLRQEGVKVQAFFTFNPELRKDGSMPLVETYFHPHSKDMSTFYNKNYEWERTLSFNYRGKEVTEVVKYLSIHGNAAEHNPYCPPSKIAFYETFKGVDDNKYNVWRWGYLGEKQNEKPFFKSAETDNLQYLNEPFTPDPKLPILVSFDFNYSPCTATLMQFNDGLDDTIDLPVGLHIYACVQIEGGTEPLCDELITMGVPYHPALIDVTGDNSARQKRSNSLRTDKRIVEDKLNTTFRTKRKANEAHADSRIFCNYWLVHGKTYIYTPNCTNLINDLKSAERTDEGGLLKDNDKHRQDAGDSFRYGIHFWIGSNIRDVQTTVELVKEAYNFGEDNDFGDFDEENTPMGL